MKTLEPPARGALRLLVFSLWTLALIPTTQAHAISSEKVQELIAKCEIEYGKLGERLNPGRKLPELTFEERRECYAIHKAFNDCALLCWAEGRQNSYQGCPAAIECTRVKYPTYYAESKEVVTAQIRQEQEKAVKKEYDRNFGGLDADRYFRPTGKLIAQSTNEQTIVANPAHRYDPSYEVGKFAAGASAEVSELHQIQPQDFTIWYHIPKGWISGRLDYSDVRPISESDEDAAATDEYLLEMMQWHLVEPGRSALIFGPGPSEMTAECNIVQNPMTVLHKFRLQDYGTFIRSGRDSALNESWPILHIRERITIENAQTSTGGSRWLLVTTARSEPSAQQGWVPTACVKSND